jgi:metal-responsive CopG/Arc/MetJ family transcriptional regulator
MAKDEVTIVSAQIPTTLRDELERRAEAGYRSLSSEIRLALAEHLLQREQPTVEPQP